MRKARKRKRLALIRNSSEDDSGTYPQFTDLTGRYFEDNSKANSQFEDDNVTNVQFVGLTGDDDKQLIMDPVLPLTTEQSDVENKVVTADMTYTGLEHPDVRNCMDDGEYLPTEAEVKQELSPSVVKEEVSEESDPTCYCLCSKCHKTFVTENDFLDHSASCSGESTQISGNTVKPAIKPVSTVSALFGAAECEVCHRLFLSSTRLRYHMDRLHRDPNKLRKREMPLKRDEPKKKEMEVDRLKRSNQHLCEKCQTAFRGEMYLLHHVCDTDFFEINDNNHYHCKTCNEVFDTGSAFAFHPCKTKAMPVSLFKCTVCYETVQGYAPFKKHKVRCNSLKTYSCEPCNTTHKTILSFEQHKIDFHEFPPRFKCTVCAKGFRVKTDFDVHMHAHTGEKPHQCELCGKSFKSSGSLYVHRQCHNKEPIYKCTLCEKKYRKRKDLHKHWQCNHNPASHVECTTCGKVFKSKDNLKSHNEIHLDRRKYKCDICGVGFNNTGSLSSHKKRHKGLNFKQ